MTRAVLALLALALVVSPGTPASAASVCVLVAALLLLTAAVPPQLHPACLRIPPARRLGASTPPLRQYAPATDGRPQPRAPGVDSCALDLC